jgi:hypothetical protein
MDKEKLEAICSYILTGMTEKEACALAGFSYNELQDRKEKNQGLRDTLEKKQIEFKFNHLKEIQKNKSEKNSMWILEKLRAEEFGTKPRSADTTTVNIISAIIKDIQNDNQGIVKISRGTIKEATLVEDRPQVTGTALLR